MAPGIYFAMRLLVTTFTYLPNRDGVATAAAAMAEGLAAHGHSVAIATNPLASRSHDPESADGLMVHEFDGDNPDPGLRALEIARFQTWLLGQSFDAVLCHCWNQWNSTAVADLGSRLEAKKILVSHGFTAHLPTWSWRPFWGLGVWLRNLPPAFRLPWTLRQFDWVTVLSSKPGLGRALDLLVAKWTGYHRVSVIPNGTYPERFAVDGNIFRNNFGIGDDLLFLCVANYFKHKNQELAVRSFRRLRLHAATLVFIGGEFGDYSRQVQALDDSLAKTSPEGRVFLLEKLNQAMISSAYAACDVFVLSATTETQPIVIIEAMGAGKPWVSTDTGFVRELPGGLIASGERAFAAAMQRLALKPAERSRLAAEGKKASLEKFSWAVSVAAYDALLRRLVPEC